MIAARAVRATVPKTTPLVRAAFVAPSIRGYATQADSKPPIQLYGVDGTYASALYTAATKSSTLDPTAKALQSLHNIINQDPKLPHILQAPTLSKSDKTSVINELLKAASVDASKNGTIKSFLDTLADNNRLSVLPAVCEKFDELMAAGRGEVEVRVTSAEELDKRTLQKLEGAVKGSKLASGRKLKVIPKVSPDIRGGLIVEVGDRTIDLSVAAKMSRMNKLLQEQL